MNLVENGSLRKWPYGTSIAVAASPSTIAEYRVGAELSFWSHGGNQPAMTLTREAFTVRNTLSEGSPQYFLRTTPAAGPYVNGGSSKAYYEFRLRDFAAYNAAVTVTFWVRSSVAREIVVQGVRRFVDGTGPDSDQSPICKTGHFQTSSDWTKVKFSFRVPPYLTATHGASDYTAIRIWIQGGTTSLPGESLPWVGGTIDIAQVAATAERSGLTFVDDYSGSAASLSEEPVAGQAYFAPQNYAVTIPRRADSVIVGPYDTASTSGAGNFGKSGGETAYEWLTYAHNYRIRQNGTVNKVKFYVAATTGLTGLYISIWRKNSAGTYDRVGTSADLSGSVAVGVNTLTVSIPGVKEGDFIGGRMTWTSASALNLVAKTGISGLTNYSTTNTATTTTGFAWESQTSTSGTAPVVECYMQAPHAVIIGDSISAGHGAASVEHYSFIEATDRTNIANSPGYWVARAFNWAYQNMGIGGTFTQTTIDRFAADVIALKPRFCIIHVGRNDVTGSTSQADYVAQMAQLLDSCVENDIIPVVSLMIGGDDISDINDPIIDSYNAALLAEIRSNYPTALVANGKPYVNTTNTTYPDKLYDFALGMTDDTIHPSPRGYRRLAQAWIDAISSPTSFGTIPANLDYFNGPLTFPDVRLFGAGDAYTPSVSFVNSPKSGVFSPSLNTVSISINESQKWDFNSTGLIASVDDRDDIGATSANRPRMVSIASRLAFGAKTGDTGFSNDRQLSYNQTITKFRKREVGTVVLNFEDSGMTTLTSTSNATAVDCSLNQVFTLALSEATTFSFSNITAGKRIRIRIVPDATPRALTWPALKWVVAAPTTTVASKVMLVELDSFGTTVGNMVARYINEP